MKILLIEDDKHILDILEENFLDEGISFDSAIDGEEGEYKATTNIYDVIMIDYMLPNISGEKIVKSIRDNNISTPIIMLTAKSDIKDKIECFKLGADDYVTKPFDFEELFIRVQALYRRSLGGSSNEINIKNIKIDIDNKKVYKDDMEIILSNKEFELLMFLVKRKNSYVSKFMIEELWSERKIKSNVVETTIFKLRKKLGKEFIKNFKGLGYKIEE